ncbi:MAG: fasciclin domain-containing protein, partial [Bacteroidota bacterium]
MSRFLYLSLLMFFCNFAVAQTVVDIIVNSADHNILEDAVIAAGLDDDLSAAGDFTVFAPTDDAFNALPTGTVSTLLQDPTGDLAKILLYHVLNIEVMADDLSDGQIARTLLGQSTEVAIDGDDVFINSAKVTITDIPASNGVVHVLDAVLMPPASNVVDVVANSPDHNILETAVIEAELDEALAGDGPFTVFAPTDAAFDLLPDGTLDALLDDPTGDLAKILLYHVVGTDIASGDLTNGQTATTLLGQDIEVEINMDGVFINDAKVSVTDINTFNGVVHVLDAVILPPNDNVAEVIVNSPNHNTLETAVIDAELDEALAGDGPFTIFAPTDDAFDLLPDGALDALLDDPTGDLARILLYHVVGADIASGDLTNGQTATTLLGQDIEVEINMDGVFINDAKVSVTDINTFNGVVHVLDAVIMPPANNVAEVVINSPNHNILETAVGEAKLVETLEGDGPYTVFAPTDAAFDLLPDGTLDDLLEEPEGQLAQILLYHVLDTEVLSTDLSDGQIATTVQGQEIEVSIIDEYTIVIDAYFDFL